jgi:hypothetical protein
MNTEQLLERLGREPDELERAPARLKSKIYSALIARLSSRGRLLSLAGVKGGGRQLCVFEHAIAALPLGERVGSMNPCRICHARVLGERLDAAPIFWPGCPYADFHKPG